MSKRAILVAGAVGALAVAAALLAALTFGPVLAMLYDATPHSDGQIQADLVGAAGRAGSGGSVRLADVVTGTWDTAYVWDGHTAAVKGPQVFGGAARFGDGASNQAFVVAFADRGRLVSWVRFDTSRPMVYFDLGGGGSLQASRDGATFMVEPAPDSASASPRLVLHLAGG